MDHRHTKEIAPQVAQLLDQQSVGHVEAQTPSGGTEASAEACKAAQKKLDKAATKGVIHPNAAARRKSRLAKRVNAANS